MTATRTTYIVLDTILLPIEVEDTTNKPVDLVGSVLPYYFWRISQDHPELDASSDQAWVEAGRRILAALTPIEIDEDFEQDPDITLVASTQYAGFYV